MRRWKTCEGETSIHRRRIDGEERGRGGEVNVILSSKVLQRSSQECLREEEPRDPEHIWFAIVDPATQEREPVLEVQDPVGEGHE